MHLWGLALHVCDLIFILLLHLFSPVFANVSVLFSWCCCVLSCSVPQCLSFLVHWSFSLDSHDCVLVSMGLFVRVSLCICSSFRLALSLVWFWSDSPRLCLCVCLCLVSGSMSFYFWPTIYVSLIHCPHPFVCGLGCLFVCLYFWVTRCILILCLCPFAYVLCVCFSVSRFLYSYLDPSRSVPLFLSLCLACIHMIVFVSSHPHVYLF